MESPELSSAQAAQAGAFVAGHSTSAAKGASFVAIAPLA